MKKNENKKNSAAKKLIPAVAMLTTSAVMLSTATYAWFTLNKEVEVTGIKMQATAGDSLEVSLGALGNDVSAVSLSTSAPAVDDVSWKRAINISEYYDSVGKLKPASSVDGVTIYHTGDQGIYAGGREVESSTAVSAATVGEAAALNIGQAYQNDTFEITSASNTEGYYIDIPVYLRCSKNEDTQIDCAVTITDPTNGSNGNITVGSELINAVRVAVIPTGTSTDSTATAPAYSGNVATVNVLSDTSPKVFSLNSTTYHGKVLGGSGEYRNALVDAVTNVAAADSRVGGIAYTAVHDNTVNEANSSPLTTVFTLSAADANKYSVESFIVRIWIEGESQYCNDATANQNWNIDLYFTIHEESNSSGNTPSEETDTP